MKEQILTILSSRAERGDLIREIASFPAERGPRNDELLSLTSRPFPPKLGRERNIFMAEPGQSEIPTSRRQKPAAKQPKIEGVQKPVEQPQSVPHTPGEKARMLQVAEMLKGMLGTPELKSELERQTKELAEKTPEQEAVRQKREESKGVLAYGQLGGEPRSIFEGIPLPDRDREIATEQGRRGRPLTEQEIADIETRVGSLRSFIDPIQRLERAEASIDMQTEYNKLYNAVGRGEISAIDAGPYFARLGEIAAGRAREQSREQSRQLLEQRAPERLEAQQLVAAIEATAPDSPERITAIQAFKDWLDTLDPDSQLDPVALGFIARYDEVGEKFLDKIISKPLATPTSHYELSFYANINLQSFLTEVRARDPELYRRYAELREATLIFHEMNRGITVESGNISAFLSLTRSVNPAHLQTATDLDGVELVRQLTEEAIGRLYTERSETSGNEIDDEINRWVARQFRSMAQEGRVKSSHTDANGNFRNLEDWEIDRALAFGRNIHSSFYRKSALYAWSRVPLPYQKWLNAPPTETVLRVLAGLKWLTYRFRFGEVGGGPEFTKLLYDEITKDYTSGKDKLQLKKIGKLDILKDIIPVGFFNGDGFDSGWRTFEAYLNTEAMKVRIDPTTYVNSSDSVKTAIREYLREKGLPEEGGDVDLGDFLIEQEYKAREKLAKGAKYAFSSNIPVMKEHLPSDYSDKTGIPKQMQEVITPIMDQINLSLGVLIKYGGSNKELRTRLWEKTADLLPLRTSYLLSEEGVKNLPSYNNVKGERDILFRDEFESKLLKAQHLRIERQKENARNGDRTTVSLESVLGEAGITEGSGERQFVEELQTLGREKASELAKISFPHIPFLEDVPFGEAKYAKLPTEVFARRMGNDFEGFFNANGALNNIVGNLEQPYPQILNQLKAVKDGISSAEGSVIAQNKVTPIFKTYLKLAEQWVWTRYVPFAKTLRGFVNLPTSWLQAKFGREALSTDESTMNRMVNEAVGMGIQRREKLPGEEKSQYDDVAEHVGAKPINVFIDQARTASVIIAFIMMGAFIAQTTRAITEEARRG